MYPFEHSLAALARAQMGTTQTQLCFILGIWARFGIINFLSIILIYYRKIVYKNRNVRKYTIQNAPSEDSDQSARSQKKKKKKKKCECYKNWQQT